MNKSAKIIILLSIVLSLGLFAIIQIDAVEFTHTSKILDISAKPTDPWYQRWYDRHYKGRLLLIGKEPGYQRYYAFTEDIIYLYINTTNSLKIPRNQIKGEFFALRILSRTTQKEIAEWSFACPDGFRPLSQFIMPTMQETIDKLCNEANFQFNDTADFTSLFIGKKEKLPLLGRILEYTYMFITYQNQIIIENVVSIWPYECWWKMPCY